MRITKHKGNDINQEVHTADEGHRSKEQTEEGQNQTDLKIKFVLAMLRVATTITNGKAEITLSKRRRVSIC